jgi:hypothetical protein
VGQLALSITTPDGDDTLRLRLVTESGTILLGEGQPEPGGIDPMVAVQQPIMAEFAAAIAAGHDHPLGAQRGLVIQQLIAAAEDSMKRRQ